MNTFESLVSSLLFSLGKLLPIGADVSRLSIQGILGWSEMNTDIVWINLLGIFLGLLFYLKYDLLSQLSAVLGMIFYRRKPNTIDELIPIFALITLIPFLLLAPSIQGTVSGYLDHFFTSGPFQFSATGGLAASGIFFLVAGSLLLFFSDYRGKHQKNIFDWNFTDAFAFGFFLLILSPFPSLNPVWMTLCFFLYRNYRREPSLKIAYLLMVPITFVELIQMTEKAKQSSQSVLFSSHANVPTEILQTNSKIALGACFFVSLITSLTILYSGEKAEERSGFFKTIVLRVMFAAALSAGFFLGKY